MFKEIARGVLFEVYLEEDMVLPGSWAICDGSKGTPDLRNYMRHKRIKKVITDPKTGRKYRFGVIMKL